MSEATHPAERGVWNRGFPSGYAGPMTAATDRQEGPGSRRRRKEARPAELVEVALACFLESGFEGTRLDQVARRAGVAKGTLYIYFASKEELFRAVVRHVTEANLHEIAASLATFEGPLDDLVPALLARMADTVATSRAPAVARLILREVDRFPDLARIWFEDVASPLLTGLEGVLAKAQARGEIRPGDPRGQVFSILGPMLSAILFSGVVGRLGYEPVDLARLATEHARTVLVGLRQPSSAATENGGSE